MNQHGVWKSSADVTSFQIHGSVGPLWVRSARSAEHKASPQTRQPSCSWRHRDLMTSLTHKAQLTRPVRGSVQVQNRTRAISKVFRVAITFQAPEPNQNPPGRVGTAFGSTGPKMVPIPPVLLSGFGPVSLLLPPGSLRKSNLVQMDQNHNRKQVKQ